MLGKQAFYKNQQVKCPLITRLISSLPFIDISDVNVTSRAVVNVHVKTACSAEIDNISQLLKATRKIILQTRKDAK